MDETEYSKAAGVRWTHLRAMSISPAHYQASVASGGDEDTKSMRMGRAIDCALLEPDRYDDLWVTYPGDRRGNAWKDFEAKNAHREILNASESAYVVSCVAALKRSPLAMAFLKGATQRLITWVDDATGIRCKARPDVIIGPTSSSTLTDLKTARDITPRAFAGAAARLGYHGQLAFYSDGLAAAGYRLKSEPIIVAVETSRPWDVVCYELGQPSLAAGRALYQRLLLQVLECEAKYGPATTQSQTFDPPRAWPGRSPDRVLTLDIPDWAIEQAAGPLDFGDGVQVWW